MAQREEFLKPYRSGRRIGARLGEPKFMGSADTEHYLWARGRASRRKRMHTPVSDHQLPESDATECGAFHTSELPYALNIP